MVVVFFFFKQKTAYEMRISDWSSDVCSSDLPGAPARASGSAPWGRAAPGCDRNRIRTARRSGRATRHAAPPARRSRRDRLARAAGSRRSEEHTSELQSLMRISYAVFCLKKTKLTQNKHTHTHTSIETY